MPKDDQLKVIAINKIFINNVLPFYSFPSTFHNISSKCPSFSIHFTPFPTTIQFTTELLLDIRLAANDIRRRIKKCEAEETNQLTRLRQSTRDGRSQISTVHAENVIRQRNELVRLESILGQLVALSGRLKQAMMINAAAASGGTGNSDATLLADRQLAIRVLQEAKSTLPAAQPVPSDEVDRVISRLMETNEDGLAATVASMQQDELMNRLQSLRK